MDMDYHKEQVMSEGLEFLGPRGGELAIAFGAGCAAGYAFCVRTIHTMLQRHTDKQHEECVERITNLEKALKIMEERWLYGTSRQMAQMSDSSIRVLGEEKLGGPIT